MPAPDPSLPRDDAVPPDSPVPPPEAEAPRPGLLARAQPVDADHPWLGLRAYTEETHRYFFGRDAEIAELYQLVRDHPLTVLYGQSGLGKTSLLGAGLIPRLRVEGYQPLLLRLSYRKGDEPPVRQLHRALATVFPGTTDAARTLWERCHELALRPPRGRCPRAVLLLDQFEEAFTLGQADERKDGVADLARQLADLIENRVPAHVQQRLRDDPAAAALYDFEPSGIRFVITLRDDYLSHLEKWKKILPSLMRHRMALEPLRGPEAFQAVVRPARMEGRHLVDDDVATLIVRTIARRAEEVPLEEISAVPPLLSLLCEQLNVARGAAPRITAELVRDRHENILDDFYRDCFAPHPVAVRHYVEDYLVSDRGYRKSEPLEEAVDCLKKAGVADPEAALADLIARRLLTPEERFGVPQIEITHDRLAPLVVKSREKRREQERAEKAEAEQRIERARAEKAEEERRIAEEHARSAEKKSLRTKKAAEGAGRRVKVGMALFVWLVGVLLMWSPLGDSLLRYTYDLQHLLGTDKTESSDAVVVLMNETDEAEVQGRTSFPSQLSRGLQAQMVDRLSHAGVALICYNVYFSSALNSGEAADNTRFANAIKEATKKQVPVILGVRPDGGFIFPPHADLLAAAAGSGTLGAYLPDPDGVVRRVDLSPSVPGLAFAAARARTGISPPPRLWLKYRRNRMPVYRFVDCLDSARVPDNRLQGKTVFIGWHYTAIANEVPTPYSRGSGEKISTTEWQATLYENLVLDQGFVVSHRLVLAALWSLPLALLSLLVFSRMRGWHAAGIIAGAALALSGAALLVVASSQILVNWSVLALVQLPLCLFCFLFRARTREKAQRFKFYLSSTTREFSKYEERIVRDLKSPRLFIERSPDIEYGSGGILSRLASYIQTCDGVIHLVGNLTGAGPPEAVVADFLRRYPDFLGKLPILRDPQAQGVITLSHAQWEAYLALYFEKWVIVATAAEGATLAVFEGIEPHEFQEQKSRQAAHRQRLRELRVHSVGEFKTMNELATLLARELADLGGDGQKG